MKQHEGYCCNISADNPASNSLGGFKESVAAYRFCRQCKANSEETKAMVRGRSAILSHVIVHLCFCYEKFNESAFLLRERESHLRECEELDNAESNWGETSKELGINYCSILFEV